MKETIRIKKSIQRRDNIVFDQVWCVFDKDSFANDIYNSAFELCENLGIVAAYSNECFELWYLLHFNLYESGMVFSKLDQNMRKVFDKKYTKNMTDIFELLYEKQADAIRNAKHLEEICESKDQLHHQNPSTSVLSR